MRNPPAVGTARLPSPPPSRARSKVVTLSCGIDTAAGASATGVTTGATGLTAAPSGDFVRTYFAGGGVEGLRAGAGWGC